MIGAMERTVKNEAMSRAISAAGGQTALARRIGPGIKQGHVWDWTFTNGRPPPGHCPAIESATGVRCEELRPDLEWERDDAGAVIAYRVPVYAVPGAAAA